MKSIFTQSAPVIIGGLGVLFIVSIGSTDLSVGGVAAVSATVGAYLGSSYGIGMMLIVSLLIGIACGALLGTVITRFNVGSFMASLAMLIGLRGVLNIFLVKWNQVYIPKGFDLINSFMGNLLILVVMLIIFGYLFEFTRFGYYCKGMGENENAMKSIGLDTKKTRHICYILSGFTASVMGLVLIAGVGGSSSTIGQFMEMKIQMAIFLGGVLVTGGIKSKIYKLFLGSFSITIIVNGLTLSGADGATSEAVEGIMMILILYLTILFSKRNIRMKQRIGKTVTGTQTAGVSKG
jgi:ribose/xylose/arabinose/galactoside ABC-type transport system permease subunit